MRSHLARACSALAVAAALLGAALTVAGPAQATLASGAYRLVLRGDHDLWLRTVDASPAVALDAAAPPPGDGRWIWWLEPIGDSDGENFAIVNHDNRFALSAVAFPGAVVVGLPESAAAPRWRIVPAGQDAYYLSYPGSDLRADSSPTGPPQVVLQPPGPGQFWELRRVGDY
ncbi:hypothetical protein ACWDOP_26790 [Nocardia sp. NPDC003693]